MNSILLNLLAFVSILSSIFVITSKNPVVAVIFLISVFINAAGYLLVLGVGFIGISYLILYTGAITVLFLFVIMLINIRLTDILEVGYQYTKNLPLAFTIGLLFAYEIYTILPFTYNNVSVLDLPFILIVKIHTFLFNSWTENMFSVIPSYFSLSLQEIAGKSSELGKIGLSSFFDFSNSNISQWLILSPELNITLSRDIIKEENIDLAQTIFPLTKGYNDLSSRLLGYELNFPFSVNKEISQSYPLAKGYNDAYTNIVNLENSQTFTITDTNSLSLISPSDQYNGEFLGEEIKIDTVKEKGQADTIINSFLQIQSLGLSIYTHYAITLIICSIILLLALVAPIFISKK